LNSALGSLSNRFFLRAIRQQNDWNVFQIGVAAHDSQNCESVWFRHGQVEQYEVRSTFPEHSQRLDAAGGASYLMTMDARRFSDRLSTHWHIVNDQDGAHVTSLSGRIWG